ncbi:MAG: quinone oxidoreductase, partial [Comamonas sp.]
MTTVVKYHEVGGPEVLRVETTSVGDPGPGQVRLKQGAVALNFADTYFRSGLYPSPLPAGVGSEACGTITAVGE